MHQCNIIGNGAGGFYAKAPSVDAVYDATDNWWGTTDSASIEALIYHKVDLAVYPTVVYIPAAEAEFQYQYPTDVDIPEAPYGTLPSLFTLQQNYPNPFNPTTCIEFYIPHRSHVSIRIYNVLGQEISLLVDDFMSEGHHSVFWDGTDSRGRAVSSGVYFYRLETGRYAEAKKMMLVK